jgi:hydrogenase expression/formation protein HypE
MLALEDAGEPWTMSKQGVLPVGKLPIDLLSELLAGAPVSDPRVRLGPGVGLDCAVIDLGPNLLVMKSDPITFVTEDVGWYLVQVNANDIATTGAVPRWMMVTLMLPEGVTTVDSVKAIAVQIFKACQELGISLVGGHTEITFGIDRPLVAGTILGEVDHDRLVLPNGARPGDRLLLTKGVPIEGTAILASEFSDRVTEIFTPEEISIARGFLYEPGISILKDAKLATAAGKVTAMHDPTEGGLAAALWELADASRCSIYFEPTAVQIPDLSGRICRYFGLDPLSTIASGALLLSVDPKDALSIQRSLQEAGISCAEIGSIEQGPAGVWKSGDSGRVIFPRPMRDEIARLFEEKQDHV